MSSPKTGRKTKYDEKLHVPWAKSLALSGKTSNEIAQEMGVARSTLYGWMGAHPEFSDAIKYGKARADAEVSTACTQRPAAKPSASPSAPARCSTPTRAR